jgi:uncharacterized membrane-anchored protein
LLNQESYAVKTIAALFLMCLMIISPAWAQDQSDRQKQLQAAWEAAMKASVQGPSDVKLADQAVIHLPADMYFIPSAESDALMQAWGNSPNPSRQGLIMSKSENQPWTISITHTAEGYVKDDDAKTWNADELYNSIKEGNDVQNEERIKLGFPALDMVGWIQPPKYDSGKHQLVWSLKAKDRGTSDADPATVNYNTYALGRDGFFEVNLMTSDQTVEADKAAAHIVLAAVEYNQGKRYNDFVAGTDHIAEYGLGALVAGVAAKKLGFLAVIGVFLAKFAKVGLIAFFAGGAAIMKFFRRKRPETEA